MSMYSDTEVHICQASNGFTVEVSVPPAGPQDGPSNDVTYIYQTLDEVIKALPSLFNQATNKKMPPVQTPAELAKMEADINANAPADNSGN